MSELLKSKIVGSLEEDRSSNEEIYYRWLNSGLLEGLDKQEAFRVALAMEIVGNLMLIEDKSCDIMHDITGVNFHENSRFETVIFPIISRIVRKTPKAIEFIPEIINDAKKRIQYTISQSGT